MFPISESAKEKPESLRSRTKEKGFSLTENKKTYQ
jgi:hypothetical protein